MINKNHRLKKNKHFKYIYRNGKNIRQKHLSLCFIKTKFKYYKVGFSVSNKIGKAVVRNKIKRRLKASFNEINQNANTKYNYIFVAGQEIENLTYTELKQLMIKSLKKADLYVE